MMRSGLSEVMSKGKKLNRLSPNSMQIILTFGGAALGRINAV
jgi:hypothetical protein